MLKSLRTMDFKYLVEVDYETDRSGCTCEGICRCSHIENARVTEVHLDGIIRGMMNHPTTKDLRDIPTTKSKIITYGLDRILRIYKVFDPSLYDVSICGGYYGQEIGEVTLNAKVAEKVDAAAAKLLKTRNLTEAVRFLLVLEYGYLLESLNGKTFRVQKVPRESITVGRPDYYRRLDRTVVDSYKQHCLPVAVCVTQFDSDKIRYRIIDGYHRLAATEAKTVWAIIGRPRDPLQLVRKRK